ncbi:S41 family peptidase [Oceanirhabdus sp. W0125-5]|uniref:S41 family peptidase n=1 Tax=Oceanirhabdus sp. W0125-5 TaxID=2999116 RepID=UPI0022F31771|nr:S41 family peptidase [Oceanirhabdus sp. W0125-5]WBW97501.1 S41 family peptidase [Oceanirhabdus sp. W0125-5]
MKKTKIIFIITTIFLSIILGGCSISKNQANDQSNVINSESKFIGNINDAILDGNLIIVMPSNEKRLIKEIEGYVASIKYMLEKNLNMNIDVITDEQALNKDLSEYNVIVYGTMEGNLLLSKYKDNFQFKIEQEKIKIDGNEYMGNAYRFITAVQNPQNNDKALIIYTAQKESDIVDINNTNHGMSAYHLFVGEEVVASGYYEDNVRSQTRWTKAIEYLEKELPKRHKNLFFSLSKEKFHEDIDNLKRLINTLSDEEITMELSKIIASVGDGHTTLKFDVKSMVPVKLFWFKEGIFITDTVQEYKDALNHRVIAVNGKNIDEVVKELSKVISHENEMQIKNLVPQYMCIPEVLKGLNIIEDYRNIIFTVEDYEGKTFDIKIDSVDKRKYNELKFTDVRNTIPLYMMNYDKYYWYKYLEKEKVLYFKYNVCSNMQDKSVKEFGQEILEFIDKNPVEKLVIDMRNNGGGNSSLLDKFIRNLKKKDINEKDKLFVIVGRETFSSAILNSLALKNYTNAVFYGEPTGGKPNHYGEVKGFSLPGKSLYVTYSTKFFKHSIEDTSTFIPDIIIEPSIESYIDEKDPVLEFILGI